MASPTLLARLGLFVRPGFLSPAECGRIVAEASAVESQPATVLRPASAAGASQVDDAVRRGDFCLVPPATLSALDSRLAELEPLVASHFAVELAGHQAVQVLRYHPGDYFRPHADNSGQPTTNPVARQRAVSVVLFLNQPTAPDRPGNYEGGALTFFDLLGEAGENRPGLPLDGETGLLVAFPARQLHAVQPVTAGERFTAVSWFIQAPPTQLSPE